MLSSLASGKVEKIAVHSSGGMCTSLWSIPPRKYERIENAYQKNKDFQVYRILYFSSTQIKVCVLQEKRKFENLDWQSVPSYKWEYVTAFYSD